jgi:hypothetical protein
MADASRHLMDELASRPVGEEAEALGELEGILLGLGVPSPWQGQVTVREVRLARRLYALLASLGWPVHTYLTRRPSSSRRTLGFIRVRLGWQAAPLPTPQLRRWRRRKAYAQHFLAGITLAAGYLGDPHKGYGLEWNLGLGAKAARRLQACLGRLGLRGHEAPGRRLGRRVYLKDGGQVGEALRHMGATDTLLRWENTRAVRAMQGRVHREVNGEAANLRRAAQAAVVQLWAARQVLAWAGEGELPPAVREAALLRVRHPQAPLAELAARAGIHKSSMEGRMRRLVELARRWGGPPGPPFPAHEGKVGGPA